MARQLCIEEREQVWLGLQSGASLREIGRRLGRSASTVSREVARHGGAPRYRPSRAEREARRRRARPKERKLVKHPELAARVAQGLRKRWLELIRFAGHLGKG